MTETSLHEQRAQNWSTAGNPVRTLEDARAFVERVGFCLVYPERSLPLIPTFIGAYAGSGDRLPDAKHAFADPRTRPAVELMVRLLRDRGAYEMSLFTGAPLVASPAMFPYFYALVGDHNPKAPPKAGARGTTISPLAITVFDALQQKGPLSKNQLRGLVGMELSNAALDRALSELWAILKITRVDYREDEGAFWDVLYRWSSQVVKEGLNISAPESISAILSKYLESAIAATQDEIEHLISYMTSRSKVREAIHALLAARELSYMTVGAKTLIRLAPAPEPRRVRHG